MMPARLIAARRIASLLLLLAALATHAQAQRASRVRAVFSDGTVSLRMVGGQITAFEFHRTNRQRSGCDVEVARDNGKSTWEDSGQVTTIKIEGSEGHVRIERQASRFVVTFDNLTTSNFCGLGRQLPFKVELYRRGKKYVVRVDG